MLHARLDERGKAAWPGPLVPAFRIAWSLDWAGFALRVASGRARAWREVARHAPGGWPCRRGATQDEMHLSGNAAHRSSAAAARSDGHDALRVHWTIELNRLDVQQEEFRTFLNQLCLVRDEEEFDRFMAGQWRAAVDKRPPERPGA